MDNQQGPLSILILGIGDFFSKLYYHTGFVLFMDDIPILVDCQDPLPKVLYEASQKSGVKIDMSDIDHLILTHLHGDHSNGLESLGFYNYFIRGKKPLLYTIPEVREDIWENKLKASMSPRTNNDFDKVGEMTLEDFFEPRILYPGKIQTILGMKIEIRYTRHFIPCFGFKVLYKGRSLGYSCDTVFDPDHIDFLSECDLILHETNKKGHTEYEKLLSLPDEIKNKMLLVHIYDEFDVKNSRIPVAREGAIYYA